MDKTLVKQCKTSKQLRKPKLNCQNIRKKDKDHHLGSFRFWEDNKGILVLLC